MGARAAASLLVGLIFSLGLGISGMTLPQNIIAFLDLTRWSPTLLFVMGGGVAVYAVGFRLVTTARKAPLFDRKFEVPTNRVITWQLVVGAATFGVGWGLGGFCGGPALVSLLAGRAEVLVFLLAMFVGMFLCQKYVKM